MRWTRGLAVTAIILAVAAVWAVATAPRSLDHTTRLPVLTGSVDDWLSQRVSAARSAAPIVPGTERRLRWSRNRIDTRTPLAVVYIHGFSATRQEIGPVPERVAEGLQANLFETRLAGHGLGERPLSGVSAEAWLEDAAELLAVGRAIGDRLVIIGTSTGATLALSLLDHPEAQDIAAFVLLAPNFGPADPNSELLTWPGGPQLARALVGAEHRWEPANELQARYWATAYPVEALVEMMRLVKRVRGQLPLTTRAALLTIYSPHDTVIDIGRMQDSLALIESPMKQQVALTDENDPGNPGMHVMAGDIMAPQNNRFITDLVIDFVLKAEQRKEEAESVDRVTFQ